MSRKPSSSRLKPFTRTLADLVINKQIEWRTEETALLHRYRSAYRLPVPSAFHNPMAHCILQSGIGPQSPTMSRPKNKRRIRREELAMGVRKNFKEAPVSENECVVELLYKVKMRGISTGKFQRNHEL